MKRLVCVVEGHGEITAVPVLCNRILREVLALHDWHVDEDPIRRPRQRLVDSTSGGPGPDVAKGMALAVARRASAVLVLCDQDDDCPASWGPSVEALRVHNRHWPKLAAVMSCREYESWLLHAATDDELASAKIKNPEFNPRDAKTALRKIVGEYEPTVHQEARTRRLELNRVWSRSKSFDKLIRALASACDADVPRRPTRSRGTQPSRQR